jgi:hypothetical protein
MYSQKVISPTQAEKLLKKNSPRRWTKVEALITRAEGKSTIALNLTRAQHSTLTP